MFKRLKIELRWYLVAPKSTRRIWGLRLKMMKVDYITDSRHLACDGPLNGQQITSYTAWNNNYEAGWWPTVDGGPISGEMVWLHKDTPGFLSPKVEELFKHVPSIMNERELIWNASYEKS